jgi:protein O-mannosyl-transferase
MKKNNSLFMLLCFASLFMLFLAYSNHFHNTFHFDDAHTIVDNAFIRDIKNIPLFFEDARTFSSNPMNQTYRPMTTTTVAIDYWLGKGLTSTFYFHLSTFIWYIAQCILMYFLFMKIINTAIQHEWNRYIALFAVSWYGLHTANAETINYICQRADSLSTLMVITGLVLYIYLPEWRRLYLYLIPVVIGILFKVSALVFAPLLFFYIMFFEKNISVQAGFKPKNFIGLIKGSLPSLLACIAMTIFVLMMTSPTFIPGGVSRFSYLITQPFVILHYFLTFFLPFNLSADSDWKVVTSIFDKRVIVGSLFITVMLLIAYITSKKQETRPVSFGILWFFLALLPASSFVPLAEVMNDHRMFFPFVGLTLNVCWYLGLLVIKHEKSIREKVIVRMSILLIAMTVLGGHAYGTYQRNKVWHTDESLWYDVTVKSPLNGRGMMNYGLSQMEKGNYQTALEYFERALTLTPYYSYLHVNMGILKGAMNQPAEAEKYFKNALLYDPQNPEPYFFYAKWMMTQNRRNEAVPLLQRALQLSPAHSSAQKLLNEILAGQKTFQTLQGETAAAVKAAPTAENYLNLSLQYHREGRYTDSINACKKALEIKPDYDLAYNNICAAYNEMKMWDKAIVACKKGLKINPSLQIVKNNLARAEQQKELQNRNK